MSLNETENVLVVKEIPNWKVRVDTVHVLKLNLGVNILAPILKLSYLLK